MVNLGLEIVFWLILLIYVGARLTQENIYPWQLQLINLIQKMAV